MVAGMGIVQLVRHLSDAAQMEEIA